ncbi:MAG: PAS domain S-box protein [Prolixibacteraceae bacterium]
MSIFKIVTPFIYWSLIIIWFYIFVFYLRKFLSQKKSDRFLKLLLVILAIDAFRTLFESFYFGAWFTSLSEMLPLSVYNYLSQPQIVFFPKLFNLTVSLLILVIIIRKWLPEEAERINNFDKEITNRTKELKESEAYNRALFENTEIGLALTSMDGKMVDVNPAFSKILGRSIEETLALNYWEITPKKYYKEEQEQLVSLEQNQKYGPYEKEYIHKNGSLIPVRLQGKIIERKGIKYIWSSVEDISKRKLAELSIQESEKRFRSIFEQSASGMCLTGLDGKLLQVNEPLCKMLGYSKDELENKHFNSITFPDDITVGNEAVHQMLVGNSKKAAFEKRYLHKSGNSIWVRINSVLLRDEKGDPQYFITQMEDVSQRVNADTQLKTSENKYRALVEQSLAGIYIFNEVGFLYVNDQFCEIFGYTREEVYTSLKPTDVIAIEDRKMADENVHERLSGEVKSVRYIARGNHKTGKRLWVEIHGTHIDLEGENVVTGTVLDITDRKKAEEEVLQSEARFKSMFNNALFGAVMYRLIRDDEGKAIDFLHLEANESLQKHLGADPKRIVGKLASEIVSKDEAEFTTKTFEHVVNTGQPCTYEHYYETYERTIEITAFQLDGDLFVSTFFDISERKKAENKIMESEERFRKVFEEGSMSMATADFTTGVFLDVNKALCKFLGYSKEELIQHTFIDVTHPDDVAIDIEAVKEISAERMKEHQIEKRYLKKNGEVVWANRALTRLTRPDGTFYALAMIEDITERKIAEQKLKMLNEELENRVVERTSELEIKGNELSQSQAALMNIVEDLNEKSLELKQKAIQLEAVNKELEAFSYSVSHDLRAPLRGVHGFTQILMEDYADKMDDEFKRICTIIWENSHKMGQLIDDLLAFSRLGRVDIQKSPIDMKKMVTSMFFEITNEKSRMNIHLIMDELAAANGDPAMLKQVWVNLLSNAIKFSSKQNEIMITISSIKEKEKTVYCIDDNGVGFDMKYVNNLFKVFQRLHSVKDFEGTGVGLAIVHRIIVRHGGAVWAESAIGKGAKFYFSLPNIS